jgi:hypothetical protein
MYIYYKLLNNLLVDLEDRVNRDDLNKKYLYRIKKKNKLLSSYLACLVHQIVPIHKKKYDYQ